MVGVGVGVGVGDRTVMKLVVRSSPFTSNSALTTPGKEMETL
ncbi:MULTISPECIES: hypothetical protein [unclassified Microcoleus]